MAAKFLGDAIPNFSEWFQNLHLHEVPLWCDGAALEFGAEVTRAIANAGKFAANVWRVDHFFNVAKALGPIDILLPRQWPVCTTTATAFDAALVVKVPIEEIARTCAPALP